jgi:hypothetical protein
MDIHHRAQHPGVNISHKRHGREIHKLLMSNNLLKRENPLHLGLDQQACGHVDRIWTVSLFWSRLWYIEVTEDRYGGARNSV